MSKESSIRKPAVAGVFYPGEPEELSALVKSYLRPCPQTPNKLLGIIAPHAGYVYSGAVAGSAYSLLRDVKQRVSTVLLIGPAHFVPIIGCAISGKEYFRTPLGDVPLSHEKSRLLLTLPFVSILDGAHQPEHALEVHLPFLQETLAEFELLPVLVGQATDEQVVAMIDTALDEQTLLVVSSDLSHYLSYDEAKALDGRTAEAIERLESHALSSQNACGHIPIRGALRFAREHHLQVKRIELANSGDTAGPRDRVVGYGAFSIYE